MQLHSVTKTLSRALVLLALVAFTASAFAQQRYVITNGDAYKRAKAMVGNKFLALNYSPDAKNPTITVKESFDESCVWYCNGKPGYYYQLDAEGDRFYLMRTGQTLHVMPVLMGTQNEVFESATQWYDWTFGVATQELAGNARYYWVILNADGNSWGLSGDTYGRPGDIVNANFRQPTTTGEHSVELTNGLPSSLGEFIAVYGDNYANGCKFVSEYHSSTASDARYYAGTTTPMVAATYTPLVVEQVAGTTSGGMTAVSPTATTMVNGNADVTVSLTTSQFTSTGYTKYTLQQIEPSGDPSYSCDYMTPWLNSTTTTAYVRYQYDGTMGENEPAAGRAAVNVNVVGYAWTLDNNLARYLDIVDVEGSTTSKILRVKSGATWSSAVSGKLTIVATYKNGEKQTLQVDVTLNVDPTAVAAEDVHATQGGEAPLSYTLTPAGATATVSISDVDGITYNNENNNINIASTVAPGEKNLTITATKADGTTVTGTFKVYVHPAPLEYSVADNGAVTFTNLPTDGTVYYTATASDTTTLKDRILNGTYTAATTGTQVSGTLTLTPGQTVYAVAAFGSLRSLSVTKVRNEGPATSVNQNLGNGNLAVVLNDLEDHSWSYYSDPASPIRSLNPADVKITYYGNGQTNNNMTTTDNADNPTTYGAKATGVKVNIGGDDENTFVYYKTLERTNGSTATSASAANGNLKYTTIPNPFQVRPVYTSSESEPDPRTIVIVTSRNGTGTSGFDNGARLEVYWNGTRQRNITSRATTTITDVPVGAEVTLTYVPNSNSTQNNRSRVTVYYDDYETIFGQYNPTTYPERTFTVAASGSSSDAKYRGFYAWRIKSLSNGLSVNGRTGVGDTITADQEIEFVTTKEYGNEIELEALWAQAYVGSGYHSGVTYERNFVVGYDDINYPATYSSIYPNGTTDGTNAASSINNTAYNIGRALDYDSKFENMNVTGNTLTADAHNLVIGRGVSGTVYTVSGLGLGSVSNNWGQQQVNYETYDNNVNYKVRIESGTYRNISFYAGYQNADGEDVDAYTRCNGSSNFVKGILGSDYDRAKGERGNNLLTVQRSVFMGQRIRMSAQDASKTTFDLTVKSGKFLTNRGDNMGTANAGESMYMAFTNYVSGTGYSTQTGGRVVTIEGGEMANIAGGVDVNQNGNNHVNSITLRVKNGTIKGAIYGGGAISPAYGDRKIIVTGGTIKGWIGAGCNGVAASGNVTTGGQTYGESFVYVGGNAYVGGYSYNGTTLINGSEGGTVFAAGKGSGASDEPNSGQMTYGTNLAIADNAVVEKDVYGGGNYGFADVNTNLQILGGTIQGSVFGGANQNKGPVVNVLMKNGTVEGSIYGGSNSSGTINQTATITISGGNVKRNVFGGGLGANTAVAGAVSVTVNGDAHIEGCVYGGGQDGKVNNSTTVTIESGTIDENVYGGGLGTAATVSGNTTVTIGK